MSAMTPDRRAIDFAKWRRTPATERERIRRMLHGLPPDPEPAQQRFAESYRAPPIGHGARGTAENGWHEATPEEEAELERIAAKETA